jgi:uncharacterized membrane protein
MNSPATTPARRLEYIDWMRGLAILIMIEAHVLDAWTLTADRQTREFSWSVILAGFAAPMFLFLAGVSVTLAASSGERKTGSAATAAARVRRRGWEVFGLAYLFRLQAYLLNPAAMLKGVLKVDILNIMGPSIVAAAAIWQVARDFRRRLAAFAAAALAITLLTPLVRTSTWIGALPDVLQWYLRATPGKNNFQIFPWAGFVFAGALVGVLLDRARGVDARGDRTARLHAWMAPAGLAFAGACFAGSYLPSIYEDSFFWTTSPMFFLLRVGLISSLLSLIYFYERRPRLLELVSSTVGTGLRARVRGADEDPRDAGADSRPRARRTWSSPMAVFGRSSLFVYWVHVELVYGVFTARLHKHLRFWDAVGGFAAFSLAMFVIVLAKNSAVGRWKHWRAAADERAPSMAEKA